MELTRDPTEIEDFLGTDVTPALDRGGFALYEPDKALYLFDPVATGVYEAHQHVSEQWRKKSIALARQARDILFTTTDATEVIGRTPKDNKAARMVAIKSGFRPLFETDEYEIVSLDILQWAARARRYRVHGEQMREQGLVATEDPLHDQYAGIVIECARTGQIDKGVWLYNQYAHLTGYEKADVFSRIPPVIDFAGTQILVLSDTIEEI